MYEYFVTVFLCVLLKLAYTKYIPNCLLTTVTTMHPPFQIKLIKVNLVMVKCSFPQPCLHCRVYQSVNLLISKVFFLFQETQQILLSIICIVFGLFLLPILARQRFSIFLCLSIQVLSANWALLSPRHPSNPARHKLPTILHKVCFFRNFFFPEVKSQFISHARHDRLVR